MFHVEHQGRPTLIGDLPDPLHLIDLIDRIDRIDLIDPALPFHVEH